MINAQEIKRRREALGLSLADAATSAGWGASGRTRWHDIEVGRRKSLELKTVQAIAKVLGVKVKDIFPF